MPWCLGAFVRNSYKTNVPQYGSTQLSIKKALLTPYLQVSQNEGIAERNDKRRKENRNTNASAPGFSYPSVLFGQLPEVLYGWWVCVADLRPHLIATDLHRSNTEKKEEILSGATHCMLNLAHFYFSRSSKSVA